MLGGGTLLSVVCLFIVRFSTGSPGEPHTLIAAMGKLVGREAAGERLVMLAAAGVILLTTCLPPLLWVELTFAQRPLSRRMRLLLIGQGFVGLAGVALTALCMSLAMATFGFGGDRDRESAGSYVILGLQAAFALASLALARRPAMGVR